MGKKNKKGTLEECGPQLLGGPFVENTPYPRSTQSLIWLAKFSAHIIGLYHAPAGGVLIRWLINIQEDALIGDTETGERAAPTSSILICV